MLLKEQVLVFMPCVVTVGLKSVPQVLYFNVTGN